MKGDTAVAMAAGNLATSLTQNLAPAQRAELERFRNLAMAQGEQIAQTGAQAVGVLMRHDVPVWPPRYYRGVWSRKEEDNGDDQARASA